MTATARPSPSHELQPAHIAWEEAGTTHHLRWRSLAGVPAPKRVVLADDRMPADTAYRLACEGTALLWRGDYQNARQLLSAMARRLDRRSHESSRPAKATKTAKAAKSAGKTGLDALPVLPMRERFHRYRLAQAQRARILGMLLLPFEAGHQLSLRRAPDARQASIEAAGADDRPYAASLRELLGIIGAHEWRKKGVEITALGARIHPHYAVFSPVRGEYVDLVAQAPLPAALSASPLAFDIGTGSGVLAAVLARRGVERVIATDRDPRALACARENIGNLQLAAQVAVVAADLFPPAEAGAAALIVCNPPWLPGRPASPLEHAVYDEGSRMLLGFLQGLAARLLPGGEGWLILSDLAEHLDLRSRAELLAAIAGAGLRVIERHDTRPRHRRAADADDPLHAARSAEITSLWRLAVS